MDIADPQLETKRIDLEPWEVLQKADSYRVLSSEFFSLADELHQRTMDQPFYEREVSRLLDEEIPETLARLNPLIEENRSLYRKLNEGGLAEEEYASPPKWFEEESRYDLEPLNLNSGAMDFEEASPMVKPFLTFYNESSIRGDEIKAYYRGILNDAENMYSGGLERLYAAEDEMGQDIIENLRLEHEPRPMNR